MNLDIVTDPSTDQGTFGSATLDTGSETRELYTWPSLELPWRDNLPDKSCIPPAPGGAPVVYRAQMQWSERHQCMLYHLLDVPGRGDIEMHAANFAGDVDLGWKSDLLGCLTLGISRGILTPQGGGRAQQVVVSSAVAMNEFMRATGQQPITVTITRKGVANGS